MGNADEEEIHSVATLPGNRCSAVSAGMLWPDLICSFCLSMVVQKHFSAGRSQGCVVQEISVGYAAEEERTVDHR